eukprot:GILI01033709.1.p1 GENE.GILI01033709.1~~GILI01033709.1.p1  ORF type:complete len:133 (+),score=33.52 GILI01033709.1:31-399(+)
MIGQKEISMKDIVMPDSVVQEHIVEGLFSLVADASLLDGPNRETAQSLLSELTQSSIARRNTADAMTPSIPHDPPYIHPGSVSTEPPRLPSAAFAPSSSPAASADPGSSQSELLGGWLKMFT